MTFLHAGRSATGNTGQARPLLVFAGLNAVTFGAFLLEQFVAMICIAVRS
jgi:hypothetical protein